MITKKRIGMSMSDCSKGKLFLACLVAGVLVAGCLGRCEAQDANAAGGPVSDAFARRLVKQQQDALEKQEQAFTGFFDRFREDESKREIEQQRDRERRRQEELAERKRQREEDQRAREAFTRRFTPVLDFFKRINAAAGEGTDAIWNLGKLALLALIVGVVVLRAADLLLTLTFKMIAGAFEKVWGAFSDALSNIVGA